MSKTQFYLHDIPLVLRDALEIRARTEGTSVANIIGESLASRYGLEFKFSGRRGNEKFVAGEYVRPNGKSIGFTLNVRLPPAVVEAVRDESALSHRPQREIVLSTLAVTLGVTLPIPSKPHNRGHGRPRGRKVKL